jgi:hypothetical protein
MSFTLWIPLKEGIGGERRPKDRVYFMYITLIAQRDKSISSLEWQLLKHLCACMLCFGGSVMEWHSNDWLPLYLQTTKKAKHSIASNSLQVDHFQISSFVVTNYQQSCTECLYVLIQCWVVGYVILIQLLVPILSVVMCW